MIKSLERALGRKILSAEGHRLKTSADELFFKSSQEPTSSFREEVLGLRALGEAVRVPGVVYADEHFLVLEWIGSTEPSAAFWSGLAAALVKLHKISGEDFGFETNNHLGLNAQTNPRRHHKEISWAEYFIEFRLKAMLTHRNLSAESLLQIEFQKALPRIREVLAPVKEKPSLVHGDLWGGNFMCAQDGEPVLIDPAPYYGHREVDLAMTELFGGFAPPFYSAYKREFPLQPGYENRRTVYNLYHLLNHWIIFGAASYREKTMAALRNI
jgi:fructosamine-3-kinase